MTAPDPFAPKPLSDVFNAMVGKPFDEAAFRLAAQRERLISRIIPEGRPVTRDFRSNRVNAHLDAGRNVKNITIG